MHIPKRSYLYEASLGERERIRTSPGMTTEGKAFDHYVERQVEQGKLRLECIKPDVLGLDRPLEVFRAERKGSFITPWDRTDDENVYCPAHWADLRIGRGACGLRCRACFLIMRHRTMCDPSHLPEKERIEIYRFLKESIREAWRPTGQTPIVAMCKEPKPIRKAAGMDHEKCNCG